MVIACVFALCCSLVQQHIVNAVGPAVISFQGKVVNADGTNVTSGSYNFDFVMYDDLSLGTPSDGVHDKWHELVKSVVVTNGVFQTNLGSVTALPDFNANSALFLAIRFNADAAGYMSPRVQMASVPYALNADKLNGIAASSFVQLGGTQNGNINIGSGNVVTSGTIGTSGVTAFNGGIATFSGAVNLGSVGTSTVASTTHIADTSDGTNSQLVTIGSLAKTTDILTLQGGGAASSIVLQTGASGGIDIGVNNVASKIINIGSISLTAQSTTVHIADSTAAAQTVILGSTSSTSTTTIQGGSGNINFNLLAGNNVVYNQATGSNFQITATAVPTADQLAISNVGQGVTSAGINGFSIKYVGGNAAVEASGARIDLTPGGTSGGTWSGLRIVANGTGPVAGVTEYGIKIEGPTTPGVGTQKGIYIGTGWDTGLDVQSGGLNLAGYVSGGNPADPAAAATDNLRVYAKRVSGRMLLKIKGPAGADSSVQPALFGNSIVLFTPTTGSTVTGGFGTGWVKGNGAQVATTTTPSSAVPAVSNQMHLFQHSNVVTTANQALGVQIGATDGDQFWTGNAAGLGGFFFNTRFNISAWPAATTRLFAGLAAGISPVVSTDSVGGVSDVTGLWHDTTDSATTFNLVTRNNITTTKTPIALTNAITAGSSYDFYMYAKPNGTTIYYRLDDIVNGLSYEGNTVTTLPRNTIFMGPQVEMSNGTANTAANSTAIGIARIYVEADH